MRSSILLALFIFAFTSLLGAQTYTKQPILMGLDQPTGISVAANGDLYFTELPTPGVPGSMGGTNRVSVLDASTGLITVVETGMPEPINIAMAGNDVYWTCRTAGVVFRRSNGIGGIFHMGLTNPTGVFATASGDVYVTQVPTPGVNGMAGGMNTVDLISGGTVTNISSGEPEPYDIVVAPNGFRYWTCRSAGVILRQDPVTGMRMPLARNLENPSGLAMDAAGNLYFTEVPTPGVFGNQGGRNKIWKVDPMTNIYTLVSFGEPEPADVTVSADGMRVYWTCKSVGVIFRADRTGDRPSITTMGTPMAGSSASFQLTAPGYAGMDYKAASSFGLGPINLQPRYVGLADDLLLNVSIFEANTQAFPGYQGVFDMNDSATAQLAIPNDPAVVGLDVFTAYVVLDPSAPEGIGGISSTVKITIQ